MWSRALVLASLLCVGANTSLHPPRLARALSHAAVGAVAAEGAFAERGTVCDPYLLANAAASCARNCGNGVSPCVSPCVLPCPAAGVDLVNPLARLVGAGSRFVLSTSGVDAATGCAARRVLAATGAAWLGGARPLDAAPAPPPSFRPPLAVPLSLVLCRATAAFGLVVVAAAAASMVPRSSRRGAPTRAPSPPSPRGCAALLALALLARAASAATVWTYEGAFVDFTYGVRALSYTANVANGAATCYPATQSCTGAAMSVAACQAWGAANNLNARAVIASLALLRSHAAIPGHRPPS